MKTRKITTVDFSDINNAETFSQFDSVLGLKNGALTNIPFLRDSLNPSVISDANTVNEIASPGISVWSTNVQTSNLPTPIAGMLIHFQRMSSTSFEGGQVVGQLHFRYGRRAYIRTGNGNGTEIEFSPWTTLI